MTILSTTLLLQSHLTTASTYVSDKASKCLNFLRHTLWGVTCEAKSMAYKSLVRPILEYACTVWSPHTAADKSTLEHVQRCAAQWVYMWKLLVPCT